MSCLVGLEETGRLEVVEEHPDQLVEVVVVGEQLDRLEEEVVLRTRQRWRAR